MRDGLQKSVTPAGSRFGLAVVLRAVGIIAIVAGEAIMPGCAAQMSGLRPPTPFTAVVGSLIIAHRGGSLEAPENTVASVAHGVACGADWQEIDVALTRDDQVVVIHDDSVDRTTGGKGLVANLSLEQVTRLIAGRPQWSAKARAALAAVGVTPPDFGDRFAREHVPALGDVLAIPDVRLMIELKRSGRGTLLVDRVLEAVHRARVEDRVAFASFDRSLLDAVYSRDPSFPLIGIVDDEAQMEAMLIELPLSVLAVRLDLVDKALARVPPGIAVWAWTAYAVPTAEELALRGLHGIITDVPAAVVAALRTPPPVRMQLRE